MTKNSESFFPRCFQIAILIAGILAACQTFAQSAYQPSPENLQARREFQDMKFGMFIHWGVYSVLGDGEWVFHNRKLMVDEYNKLPRFFDPEKFDAKTWVSLAKAAGMKYITITSRHHDGFAMFDSKISDWNIVQRTPYGKDPLKMLAEEAHRQGIKLFFYYSQLDWHNPDYYPLGSTGHASGRPAGGDFNRYLDYMDAQLRELLTNYGEIGGIWFDGMWDKPDAEWRLNKTYSLIHSLQPAALVGSNHHLAARKFAVIEGEKKRRPAIPLIGLAGLAGLLGVPGVPGAIHPVRKRRMFQPRQADKHARNVSELSPPFEATIDQLAHISGKTEAEKV